MSIILAEIICGGDMATVLLSSDERKVAQSCPSTHRSGRMGEKSQTDKKWLKSTL